MRKQPNRPDNSERDALERALVRGICRLHALAGRKLTAAAIRRHALNRAALRGCSVLTILDEMEDRLLLEVLEWDPPAPAAAAADPAADQAAA